MSLTKAQAKKMFKREVYRNLRFKDDTVYSVRKDGLVEGHALCQVMDGCTFSVGPKGNQRVRDEQRKNVHAVIRGYVINTVWRTKVPKGIKPTQNWDSWAERAASDMAEIEMCGVPVSRNTNIGDENDPRAWTPMFEWKQVTYNPYKHKTFVTVEDERPIFKARKVVISKEVWAMIPTHNKQEQN
jgi:hypothetical protein